MVSPSSGHEENDLAMHNSTADFYDAPLLKESFD
jgi:hypothetical protein